MVRIPKAVIETVLNKHDLDKGSRGTQPRVSACDVRGEHVHQIHTITHTRTY